MMNKIINTGGIEVICGPMFAGKSEELIRKINRLLVAKIDIICFKPEIDTRSGNHFVSRNGKSYPTINIKHPKEIFNYLNKSKAKVIAIDEVQFFDNSIVEITEFLAKKGYYLILSGLDKNYKGKPFGPIPELLSIADYIYKLSAVCTKCGNDALYTYRLNLNNHNHNDNNLILIGDNEAYEARCRQHFDTNDNDFLEYENLLIKE